MPTKALLIRGRQIYSLPVQRTSTGRQPPAPVEMDTHNRV